MISILKLIYFGIFFATLNGQDPTEFPESFRFGSATASYQIEGGWDTDGRGPSIWDTLTHISPSIIADQSTGDVAADSYHLYREDVKALVDAEMNFYRFSISWSRILPDGDIANVNELGILYYNNLINELLGNGIEPMVTMYHWDLPQRFQDLGGWTNPIIIDHFERYAGLLYQRYGDRVKYWITFNEAALFCEGGYGWNPFHAPIVHTGGIGGYLCAHHVILSHARAFHLYRDQFYAEQGGKIGISLNTGMSWPLTDTDADRQAADRSMQFQLGWFAHPIYSEDGGYPPVMVDIIRENSEREGRAWSRLPPIEGELREYIKGTFDFMGLNYYTSGFSREPTEERQNVAAKWNDEHVWGSIDPAWPVSKSDWLRSVPEGLRDLLIYIKDNYNNPELIITENGWSDDGQYEDDGRIKYMTEHLQAVLDARAAGCNVTGYTMWSIIDNFEWTRGYTEKFGIYHVDFESPNKERTPKKSVGVLREIIRSRRLPEPVQNSEILLIH